MTGGGIERIHWRQIVDGDGGLGDAAGIDRSFVSVSINFRIKRQLYSGGHVAKTIATDVCVSMHAHGSPPRSRYRI